MAADTSASLLVTITPSQSAFFAGELFAATITFANPARPVTLPAPTPSSNRTPRTAGPTTQAAPKPPSNVNASRQRPPSASHLGLAEYASSHLDTDEIPASPFIGNSSGAFKSEHPPPLAIATAPLLRESSISTTSGGALKTPQSATFLPHLYSQRSVSTTASPVASTSRMSLPTRKGLIGKPLPNPTIERNRLAGGGLYGGGPRRPGDAPRAHGRTQSMAVSSPDLLESTSNGLPPNKTHGRSRLGGSMAVGGSSAHGKTSPASNGREEPPSPARASSYTSTTSPPPSGATTPSTSTPSLHQFSALSSDPSSSKDNYPYSQRPSDQSNALSSNFSLNEGSEYDPTDSNGALPGAGFYGVGQNDTMESLVREGVEDWTLRATSQGANSLAGSYSAGPAMSSYDEKRAFSEGRNPYSGSEPVRNAFLHPPNTISILWSFAHLEGTFEVEDSLIKPAEFVEVKKALLGGAGTGMGMGGGTMEDGGGKSGWRSWLFGGGEQKGIGATLEDRKNYTMKEKTVPTFSSPPSILGIDLVLEPGQTKSYSFSIRVPADLPPAFRGKAIKFSYHLVVGTNRVTLGSSSQSPSRSRVMRVPVRVYNHVGITGARPFYDLTNPIVYHRDEAITNGVDDPQVMKRTRRPNLEGAGREDFEVYAAALLDSVIGASPQMQASLPLLSPSLSRRTPTILSPAIMESLPSMRPEMAPRMHSLNPNIGMEDEEGVGCKAAVEVVTRNSQKVSYDINKDGYMVASLTLVKSAYRLGETVNGSVVINSGDGRVLRVSARLETHELIETTIATKSAPQIRQITRRLHAEHHEMTLDSARVGFALAIPSGATPDFATSGVKLQWSVRLSFLVIPPSPDTPVLKPGERARPGVRVPPPPLPSSASSSRHGRSKSFAYGFEPAVALTLPAAPLIQPTGAAHLMPVTGPLDTSSAHTSYRAVPDLGYVPVLYSAVLKEGPPVPGPLQRTASGTGHRSAASLSGAPPRPPNAPPQTNVVLVPAKVETVECSIPIKVYPGNTPFRPTISCFDDSR
ncbi:RAB6A-GEF complex partner protein 2, partial [Phenoliferia sp. Uapishka_3]